MPRKKKGRLTKKNRYEAKTKEEHGQLPPQSFVIFRGTASRTLKKLTQDFRTVMEPNTASKLKHTQNNSIKDYVSVAGSLHVTHLVLFSQTSLGPYLKLCRLPQGPTLTFRIKNFALCQDVLSSLKRQHVFGGLYLLGPCLMTNLQPEEGEPHLQLTAKMFLDMFPTITPQKTKTASIQRCCLIHYDAKEGMFDFRHYSIRVVPIGLSKAVKKFSKRKLPDLSQFSDVSEFMTKSGILSESEAEDDPSSQVTVSSAKKAASKLGPQKSSVRLSELGPRMTLELIKIEEGLLDGTTLYNLLVSKTPEQKLQLEKKRRIKRQLKLKRKEEQEKNVEAKKRKKEEHKKKCLEGMAQNKKSEKEDDTAGEDADGEDDDDIQYYRDEVGQEPDADLFQKKRETHKKRASGGGGPPRKKFKSRKNVKS